MAYSNTSKADQRLFRLKAHEVRAMTASWAFLKNASLDSILQACSWRSHSTFTSYYLRDLTRIQGDLLKLSPFVSALH
jgi:hypothetical protein